MSLPKTENGPVPDLNDSGCVPDTSVCDNVIRKQPHLLDLSDDVLLYILKRCTPRDLKALGFTCSRLATLICDHTLWQRVDCRDGNTGQERLSWLLAHCLCEATAELKIKGYVNAKNKCLGIQDSSEASEGMENISADSSDCNVVDNLLYRMWYPNLSRVTVSPRWLDNEELLQLKAIDLNQASKRNGGSGQGQPGTSGQSQPGTSGQSQPGTSGQGQPGTSGQGQPGTSGQGQPVCSGQGRPIVEQNGSKHVEVNGSKIAEPSTSRGEPKVNREPEEEPMDVTMPAGPSTAGPGRTGPKKPSTECSGPHFPFTVKLMRELKYTCPNITSLFIEYCDIDYKTNNLSRFPPNLKKLSLRGTRCYNQPLHSSYLCKIQDYLRELEYLDVSACEWFEPASLMPVSKVPKLQELYMRECMRLAECVAYASLAARYGFRTLRVLDARGSPLADSEVSALGWLPLLEELYVAPPAGGARVPEHAHGLNELLPTFDELDPWETEAPEYFANKCCEIPDSPPPDKTNENAETRDIAEIRELSPSDAVGDRPWGGYERRIIVIQPNANHEMVVQRHRPPAYDLVLDQPPPLVACKRPHDDEALNLVKRPRQDDDSGVSDEASTHDDDTDESANRPNNGPNQPNNEPNKPNNGPNRPSAEPNNPEGGASRPKDGANRPLDSASCPMLDLYRSNVRVNRLGGGANRPHEDANRPNNANGGGNRPNNEPNNANGGANCPNNEPNNANGGANRPNNAPNNANGAANQPDDDMNPPVRRVYRQQFRVTSRYIGPSRRNDEPPNEGGPNPPNNWMDILRHEAAADHLDRAQRNEREACPHVRRNHRGARFCDGPSSAAHVLMRLSASPTDMQIYHSHNYDLVTDSSVFRFGRGVNEHVVHLGMLPVEEFRARPDRSNLRVLSITGYRNITDRSLVHLATAAPHLRLLDFTETNVTDRGVDIFKAIRPDCEVKYSIFSGIIK